MQSLASGDSLEAPVIEKNRAIARLYPGGSTKRPPSRAGDTSGNTSPRTDVAPGTLRRRTTSGPDMGRAKANLNPGDLRPGVSIVEQIGQSDYSGWMRKRGERYNTWKMRYFVLKGPHLYYLRSRSVR